MKKPCFILGGMFLVSALLAAAEIRVTNPNASSNWCVGTAYTITWTASGAMPDRVTIRLRRAGSPASEPAVEVISPGTSLTGPCRWTIPDSVAPGRYFVRVKTIGGTDALPDVTGDSADFTISPKILMAPVNVTLRLALTNFKVVSPNGGERIEQSLRTAIRWSYSGSGEGIRLSIWVSGRSAFPEYPAMAEGLTREIARDVPIEGGSFDWIPSLEVGKYRISIHKMDPGGRLLDTSDEEFDITSATRLLVSSPSAGLTYNAAHGLDIDWEVMHPSPHHSQNVRISIIKYADACGGGGGVVSEPLATVPVSDRHFHWNIPADFRGGGFYTARLNPVRDGDFPTETAPGCFRIQSRTRVRITYPNGGERFRRTDFIDVRWNATDALPGQKVIVLFCYYPERCGEGIRKCGRIFWVAPIEEGHHEFPASMLEGIPRSTFQAHIVSETFGEFPEDLSDNCFTIE